MTSSSSSFYGPSTAASPTDASGDLGGDGHSVCDTVVLICLACASCLIVLTVAVCFRRAFSDGYAAVGARRSGGAAAASGCAGRRCGLAPSALAALPRLAYRRGVAGGWAQCAICLAVVRDGETVRLLPACGHLFHVSCIDAWLHSHATCPLCRRDVGEAAAAAEKV
ncbi:hypothetical protein PR202_ga07059 [Eleusine coracana subsp. coracana]|uniref:RING-type E3 ubiquitin transferase n=1 Tax=Eleusine coracana subsp. coracana TaxID=191504 RepID=A0AAV5BWN1_ELECO|nr:hypothetical protein PR202_ga07059 [Eleusine coracana subsp. coracana]